MSDNIAASPVESRLARLLRFADLDPGNLELLADTAQTAFDEGELEICRGLLQRFENIEPLSPPLSNVKAMIAISESEYEEAIELLRALQTSGVHTSQISFNLAWAYAMQSDHESALACLDDAAIAASPRGPMLKVQMLHHLGRYEEGLAIGRKLAALYPDNQPLMGALATLAMDAGDMELSRTYAACAPDDWQGITASGLLELEKQNYAASLAHFDRALTQQPQNPRAWVGKGLGLLAAGDTAGATRAIDEGAQLFDTHLGSWIAAGWVHFIAGDAAQARSRFERSIEIDPNFAESYGGLAVLDVLSGNYSEAERNTEIALRLDRQCLGGVLAKTLLLDQSGQSDAAQKLRNIALNNPVTPDGQTLAQLLVRHSFRS